MKIREARLRSSTIEIRQKSETPITQPTAAAQRQVMIEERSVTACIVIVFKLVKLEWRVFSARSDRTGLRAAPRDSDRSPFFSLDRNIKNSGDNLDRQHKFLNIRRKDNVGRGRDGQGDGAVLADLIELGAKFRHNAALPANCDYPRCCVRLDRIPESAGNTGDRKEETAAALLRRTIRTRQGPAIDNNYSSFWKAVALRRRIRSRFETASRARDQPFPVSPGALTAALTPNQV